MAMICQFCGTEIKDNETVCPLCGTVVENASAPVVEEVKPVPEAVAPVQTVPAAPAMEECKFVCTGCGKEYPAGTKFCAECGGKVEGKKPVEEITPVWICSQCGKEFDSATKFCCECGGKVFEKNANAEQTDVDAKQEIKKYKSYKPEKALELLKKLVGRNGKAVDVVEAYNLAIRLGKIEDGKQYLTMLCELAENDDADALYAFICNRDLKGYEYEHYLEKTEYLANKGNAKAIDAMRQHCFWYDDEDAADRWEAKLPQDYKSAAWQSVTIDDVLSDAQAGDLDAIESLADIYENEEEDYEEAAKWYKKIIPAKKKLAQAGDAQAMEWLFDNFRDGTKSLSEDEKQEMFWYNNWESHLRKITQAGLPVYLWAMHKDIQKLRYKSTPSKYYAREIASAEKFDCNYTESVKWYKKAGISVTVEELSGEKDEI